ncbi:MAG: DUF362 domain-containing protein [Nitrospirota bacterium]
MVDTTENPMLKFLPDEIYGWKAQKKVENYNRETIYDYMDGAGEIYLAYNLVQYQNIGEAKTAFEGFINAYMPGDVKATKSGCIKNYIMFTPWPPLYHPDSCADLGAIWRLPVVRDKTRLNVLILLTPLFHGIGPHHFDPTYTWPYKGILIGTDPVALDAVGLKILELKRLAYFGENIPLKPPAKHIAIADIVHKIGTRDLKEIELVKLGWMGEAGTESTITTSVINALGGIKRFISRGDIVVIKPNIAFDRLLEHAANTNPDVVATVVRLCLEAGAKKVKVFDRPVNDPRRCYVQSDIAEAAKRAGAEVSYIDERRFIDIEIKGTVLKRWPIYKDIFEADKLINIPIAKHHNLARLTMAMKNWMGVIGGSRRLLHQNIDESLADLSLAIKPTLTILDAVRILIANGPQGGGLKDVRRLDTVIAGVGQVAVDAYGATLFGMKGRDLRYLTIAAKRGLGKIDIENLNVKHMRS